EALVRWETTKYGMIYPDRFIPIFEQNGFITHIDFYILEKACIFIKNSIKNGIVPLPIAVNFSRVHIPDEGFVEHVFQVVNHYGVSPNLIEIEFTESIYLKNAEALIEVISNLRYLGFSVALDDFGSAYSSLNYLKELPVDVIKIDKEFLSKTTKSNRGKMIIAKVVELIKSLKIVSVMEGVETQDELSFLAKIGCNVGQGYLFSKAIPTSDFITFVKQGKTLRNITSYLEHSFDDINCENNVPQEFIMDNWELYTLGKNVDIGLMKGYLDDDYHVQYVNDRALEYLDLSRTEFREMYGNSIRAFTHPEDEDMLIHGMEKLKGGDESIPFKTRAIRKDGTIIVLQGRGSSTIDNQGNKIGIYAFRDVSEEEKATHDMQLAIDQKIKELKNSVNKEKQSKRAIQELQESYRIILEQSNDVSFEWDFKKDQIYFSKNYKERYGLPTTQNNVMTNSFIKTYVMERDIEGVMQYLKDTYQNIGTHEVCFRLKAKDGTYSWVSSFASALCDDEGVPFKALGIIKNKY
ncbi:MAG: EAL domain-containing protein, partial [Coprobacillus sp.]